MNRLHLHRIFGWVIAAALVSGPTIVAADDRPNLLWISCEDISPNLGCYGDPVADTPDLDELARQGVRFDRAFTPAGVCAIVRSSLITGRYATSIGSQHMRSRIIPPADVRAFPELLRGAGYFTTNREKTDYQFEPTPGIWDRQGRNHNDWRDRPDPDQPFFSVINLTGTHESQIRHDEAAHAAVIDDIGQDRRHDPDAIAHTLPPHLADTPATRRDWARYRDNITQMDRAVGRILRRLAEDGLADNTLVVFWSDHGMGLPRGKRWLYDTGTRVPLIVRWPDKLPPGTVREDLTSILDLVPTMLHVAGVSVPRETVGRVLFTADQPSGVSEEPAYLFFYRDRMDSVYDLQRAARDRRWKYIVNFQPHKPYSQHLDYMDQMPSMQELRRLAAADGLADTQRPFMAATKPVEELYDTLRDPAELNNLADQPQYARRVARMRAATFAWQDDTGDLGMVPEAVMMEEMLPDGRVPQTSAPTFQVNGESLTIRSATEGASITYRIRTADGWSPWRLYTRSIDRSPTEIQAIAGRLGYRDSDVVSLGGDEAAASEPGQ